MKDLNAAVSIFPSTSDIGRIDRSIKMGYLSRDGYGYDNDNDGNDRARLCVTVTFM